MSGLEFLVLTKGYMVYDKQVLQKTIVMINQIQYIEDVSNDKKLNKTKIIFNNDSIYVIETVDDIISMMNNIITHTEIKSGTSINDGN